MHHLILAATLCLPCSDGLQDELNAKYQAMLCKDELTTDIGKWTEAQREAYVDALLRKSSRLERQQNSAYDMYHVIKYDLLKINDPDERGWDAEELHPALERALLAKIGVGDDPFRPLAQSIDFGAVGALAELRQNGYARGLDEIARDPTRSGTARVACVLTLHVAGEDLMPKVLVEVLESEPQLETRLTAIESLMLCTDSKLAGPVLLKLLDDPNREVRAAALCGLFGSHPPEALPKLAGMLEDERLGRYQSFLLDLIGEYGDSAAAILATYLEKSLRENRSENIYAALSAFEEATGQRFREAGAHDAVYYRSKALEALAWWKALENHPDSPQVAAEFAELLKRYDGEPLPQGVLQFYAGFVAVASEPTIWELSELCLPNSVTISTALRPKRRRYTAHDLNLPFLESDFSREILHAEKKSEHTFLLRTATSYLRLVETATGTWKIYGYGDKPIE